MIGSRGETCPDSVLACVAGVGWPAARRAPGGADDGPDPSLGDRLRRGGICGAAGWRVALAYADRHLVPASGWDFSSVVQEASFMAVPVVGFVLASRRPGNRVG